MKEEPAEKLKRGKPAKRKGDAVRKPITEKQRAARRANAEKMGKKNGATIRAAKAQTEADKIRTFARPTYTSPILFAYRIAKYFYQMDTVPWENTAGKHIGKPYTDTGIDLALGIDRNTANEIEGGSLDHIIAEQDGGVIVVSLEGIQNKPISTIEDHILPYVLYLLGNPDFTYDKTPVSIENMDAEALETWGSHVYFSQIIKKARQSVANQREFRVYDRGSSADIYATKARDGWQDEQRITFTRNIITRDEARELLGMVSALPEIE